MYCCMLVLYCYIYICEQLYWCVTSHKWVPVFMTSNTVKYNKIYKIIFAFVLQCPKWSSEKCGVCKSFHAWADKKVSTVLLIQCDYKGLLHLNYSQLWLELWVTNVQNLQCFYTTDFHKLHSNKINVRNESLITFCRHTVNEFLHVMLLRYA
jgi:hypothetical protein